MDKIFITLLIRNKFNMQNAFIYQKTRYAFQ